MAAPSAAPPSLSSRRDSFRTTSPKPLVRPTPVPPRSTLLQSPTRASPSFTQHRPYSPPSQPHPTTRYPSPPIRPQSVVGRTNSPSTQHPQNVQALEGPRPEELIAFASLARRLYYEKDANAARAVDATLQRLPAASRTAFARTLAGVRSQFHRDEEIRRRAEVEALLSSSLPGRKVMEVLHISEGGTSAMRSKRARKERMEGLAAFLRGHCLKGLPGTQPFFRSLYAVLYLQGLPAAKGGAGKRRVEWEVDVTVFSEAGGGSWMKDSIETLKGLLGFSETIKEGPPESYFDEDDIVNSPPLLPTASDESPSETDDEEPADLPGSPSTLFSHPPKRAPPIIPPQRGSLRTRSSSDPFLDPGDRRIPLSSGPLTTPFSPALSGSTTPSPLLPSPTSPRPRSSPTIDRPPPPQFRIFTLPSYLTDPELAALASLFPPFITSRAKASKFATPTGADEESAGATARLGAAVGGGEEVRAGHGEIRIGAEGRDEGWRGTGWERFVAWLKRLFGMG